MSEREAFLKAIEATPLDRDLRAVYADWLEEHDAPEESDRQRKYVASYHWLTDWVRSVNYGKWEYDEDGDYLLDHDGKRVPAKKDNLGDPHTVEDAIEAGHAACRGRVYCWATDAAQDYFFAKDYNGGDKERVREWFGHWSVVTGAPVPGLEDKAKNPPFRCAC